MPNGGEHFEIIGFCPLCGSSNIRRRQRLRPRVNWRCRSCNKVFQRPELKEAAFHGTGSGLVFEIDVARLEGRVARRFLRSRRGKGKRRTVWLLFLMASITAIIIALFLFQNPQSLEESLSNVLRGLGQSGSPVRQPASTDIPEALPVLENTSSPIGVSTRGLPDDEETVSSKEAKQGSLDDEPATSPNISSPARTLTPTPENLENSGASEESNSLPPLVLGATPTPAPTPTLAASPTPPLTSTPAPAAHLRHWREKELMLTLINRFRSNAGLSPVEMGTNIAVQLHAEASLENCTSSHWGVDGLKPYMRYSLAGGYQSNAENGHGLDYCITRNDNYRAIQDIDRNIREAVVGWMESPGHRDNILNMWHKKVNIGLAWDTYNFVSYQHFEGDYVEYEAPPRIDGGQLVMEGKTKNGIVISRPRDLAVQVFFDPPPQILTRGQLSRTYCYGSGVQVAALREPLRGRQFWPTNTFNYNRKTCPDPYQVPASAPAPRSADQAHAFWQEAYSSSLRIPPQSITVPWITADVLRIVKDQFSVKADLADVVAKHGNGVYTVLVWAKTAGEDMIISEYSIFHGTEPPDIYHSP